jgi:hypothetical protein
LVEVEKMDNNLVTDDFIGNISPHSRYHVVKIGFGGNYVYKHTYKKNIRLQILVGFGVSKELEWKTGDYIDIDPVRNYLLLKKIDINKNNDSEYKLFKGYKFKNVKNSYSNDLSLTCNFLHPPADKKIRTVKHEIITTDNEKHLKVFLDKFYPEEKGKVT